MSYSFVKKIALGGMAEVWLATQPGDGDKPRIWCVKRILPHCSDDEEFIQMFKDEFFTTARLNHPNLVSTKELIKLNGSLSIVMEYIPGVDIRDILVGCERQQIHLPVPLVCFIAREIALGLDYVHKLKDKKDKRPLDIVHRDMSPQNVLISLGGQVKIIDFGIADRDAKLNVTKPGVVKGKFSYMSPEQVLTKPIDHRTDQFALGVIFWEMLAMQKLFHGATEVMTVDLVRMAKITKDLRELNSSVDEKLSQIVHKALSRNLKSRFKDCGQFAREIDKYIKDNYRGYDGKQELSRFIKKALPKKEKKIRDLISLAYEHHTTSSGSGEQRKLAHLGNQGLKRKIKHSASQKKMRVEFDEISDEAELDDFVSRLPSPSKSPSIMVSPRAGEVLGGTSVFPTSLGTYNSGASSAYHRLPEMSDGDRDDDHKKSRLPVLAGVVAALMIVTMVALFPKWSSQGGSASQASMIKIDMVPSNLMISINGKNYHDGYVASPLVLSSEDLKQGENQLVFSRAGFQPRTYKVQFAGAGVNKKLTVILEKTTKTSAFQLMIHPKSKLGQVAFRMEKNLSSGVISKGDKTVIKYLLRDQTYVVEFQPDQAGRFTCELLVQSSSSPIRYYIFHEEKRCFRALTPM